MRVDASTRAVRWAALAAALALAPGLFGCGSRPGKLRLVLVTLETLRWDRFAPAPTAPSKMPLTWERAQRGAVFTRFQAASSSTQPSHATMFTALHPWQHGVTANGEWLAPRFHTLAEELHGAGFETRAVVAAFPVSSRFGFAQGFDEYEEEFGSSFYGIDRWEDQPIPGGDFFAVGADVTDRALESLDAARSERQFFWFHYFDPHDPYGKSLGYGLSKLKVLSQVRHGLDAARLLERVRRLYDADVASLDESLDRLLRRLEADADYETHVLVVADHGESLGEDDSIGHGYRVDETQVHVPAFLLSPRVEPGARDDLAASIDVTPTLLSLAELADGRQGRGGRDLTTPADEPEAVYGMRRTFREHPAFERRLDGRAHPVEPHLFYAFDRRGRRSVGNSDGVHAGGSVRYAESFAEFESALARREAAPPLDPLSERALEALGYAE